MPLIIYKNESTIPRRDVTDGSLDVVGDPFNEVAAVLVLDVQHLLINLKRRDFNSRVNCTGYQSFKKSGQISSFIYRISG